MLRRLFTVAAALSLLASLLLAIGSYAHTPGNGRWLVGRAGDRGSVLVFNGVVSVARGGGKFILSVSFSELAILCALPALAWGMLTLYRLRRQRKPPRGFPVEPAAQMRNSEPNDG